MVSTCFSISVQVLKINNQKDECELLFILRYFRWGSSEFFSCCKIFAEAHRHFFRAAKPSLRLIGIFSVLQNLRWGSLAFFPRCKTFAEAHRKSGSKTKIAHADKSIIKSGKEEGFGNVFWGRSWNLNIPYSQVAFFHHLSCKFKISLITCLSIFINRIVSL